MGSNTARLVVYACEPEKSYRLVDQIREPTRLAEGLAATGSLSEAAMDRAITVLRLFRDYARDTHLSDLTVFATSAAREAANGAELIDRVRALGLDVAVLDGEQEAAHGTLAVANGVEFENAWIIDLGGGSAQISRMERREFAAGRSQHAAGAAPRSGGAQRRSPPPSDGCSIAATGSSSSAWLVACGSPSISSAPAPAASRTSR